MLPRYLTAGSTYPLRNTARATPGSPLARLICNAHESTAIGETANQASYSFNVSTTPCAPSRTIRLPAWSAPG
jgi:hypothetical protein